MGVELKVKTGTVGLVDFFEIFEGPAPAAGEPVLSADQVVLHPGAVVYTFGCDDEGVRVTAHKLMSVGASSCDVMILGKFGAVMLTPLLFASPFAALAVGLAASVPSVVGDDIKGLAQLVVEPRKKAQEISAGKALTDGKRVSVACPADGTDGTNGTDETPRDPGRIMSDRG